MEKLRILMVTIAVMAIVSCAGYLTSDDGSTTTDNDHINTLSLVSDSNKFVSSDTNNDITPFLYRETNGSNPVLFFASDRDGSYDIWMARMDPVSGKFFQPEKMDILVNTADNEFSPVVFRYSGGLYISFLRVEGAITNVYICGLTNNMIATNCKENTLQISANRIGLYYSEYDPVLYAANGTTSYSNYYFDGYDIVWSANTPLTADVPVYSASGFQECTSIAMEADYISEYKIFDAKLNDKHQLYMYVRYELYDNYSYFTINALTNSEFISNYTSDYNDKDPMIDYFDFAKKVYFSSDRTGKGVYDLYRYNTTTFTNVVPDKPAWMNGY